MQSAPAAAGRLIPQAMPANIRSIQPGGGTAMRVELGWGRLRRAWLRKFRPGYVRAMFRRRCGHCPDCAHDIIDPRDLKFYRNVCGFWFRPEDDRFGWRDRLPLTRDAGGEIVLLAGLLALVACFAALLSWHAAAAFATMFVLVIWFFRDPPRRIPDSPDVVLAPADGRIMAIEELEHDPFVDGPAVKIAIFLSLLNVHVNRAPLEARVISLEYRPGKFRAAWRREAAIVNEQLTIALETEQSPYRRLLVRQIAGAVARRIVCHLRIGQAVKPGEKLGMIKFGSRTEVIVPKENDLELFVRVGTRVKAGGSALARYRSQGTTL